MVINKFGDRLYKGLVDTITRHLRASQKLWHERVRCTLRLFSCRWLSNAGSGVIIDPLAPHCVQDIAALVEDAQGDKFLRELKLRWDNHNKSMHMIRDILMVIFTPAILPNFCTS